MIRNTINFLILLKVKLVSRLFWRHRVEWVGEPPEDPWGRYRLIVMLNHTSLYEWLWAGSVSNRFLWQIATRALVPVADKTIRRPLVGSFFRLVVPNTVPITREADHTWQRVLDRLTPEHLLIIFPEGRMKRANGLDKNGKPMTVRGGVADILQATDSGRMLVAYSGGLHHIQAPGQHVPSLFKTITLRLESVDIKRYKETMMESGDSGQFKRRVKADMQRRRDHYCLPGPGNPVPDSDSQR